MIGDCLMAMTSVCPFSGSEEPFLEIGAVVGRLFWRGAIANGVETELSKPKSHFTPAF